MATDADGNNNPCAAGRAGASPLVRTRNVLPARQHDGVHCQAIHHIGRAGCRSAVAMCTHFPVPTARRSQLCLLPDIGVGLTLSRRAPTPRAASASSRFMVGA